MLFCFLVDVLGSYFLLFSSYQISALCSIDGKCLFLCPKFHTNDPHICPFPQDSSICKPLSILWRFSFLIVFDGKDFNHHFLNLWFFNESWQHLWFFLLYFWWRFRVRIGGFYIDLVHFGSILFNLVVKFLNFLNYSICTWFLSSILRMREILSSSSSRLLSSSY